jgi:hypothetical protein
MRPLYQQNFVSKELMENEQNQPDNWESYSEPDYDQDIINKEEEIERRSQPKLGLFEKSKYMEKIFPSLKIQKPGYDLYGCTTSIFACISVFVFVMYSKLTFDSSAFVKGVSSVWTYDKALTMVVLIFIMILERIANRTDTKKVEKKTLIGSTKDDQGFFNNEEMFKKTSTNRSMTV